MISHVLMTRSTAYHWVFFSLEMAKITADWGFWLLELGDVRGKTLRYCQITFEHTVISVLVIPANCSFLGSFLAPSLLVLIKKIWHVFFSMWRKKVAEQTESLFSNGDQSFVRSWTHAQTLLSWPLSPWHNHLTLESTQPEMVNLTSFPTTSMTKLI